MIPRGRVNIDNMPDLITLLWCRLAQKRNIRRMDALDVPDILKAYQSKLGIENTWTN